MADPSVLSALQRKIVKARDGRQGAAVVSVLTRAFATGAEQTCALPLTLDNSTQRVAAPDAIEEALPEDGLLAFLAAADGAVGVIALDTQMLAALIEIQTLGIVRSTPAEVRATTRTDLYMCETFINTVLQSVSEEAPPGDLKKMFQGFHLENAISDRRKMCFRLTEDRYSLFDLSLGLGDGAKDARVLICLPAERCAPGQKPGGGAPDTASWSEQLHKTVAHGAVRCNMILHRKRMPLSEVTDLKIGDRVNIPLTAIATVEVTGCDGGQVATARLGQVDGQKAVRINAGAPADREYSAITVGSQVVPEIASLATPDAAGSPVDVPGLAPGVTAIPDAPGSEPSTDSPPLPDLPPLADSSASEATEGLAVVPDLPPLPDPPSDSPADLTELPPLPIS